MSDRTSSEGTNRTSRGPARWIPLRIDPGVFYVLLIGLLLLGSFAVFKKHLPLVIDQPDWSTKDLPAQLTTWYFYARAWLAAGLGALVFSGVVLWLDRHEREPWRLLLIAFLAGALVVPAILGSANGLRELRRSRAESEVERVLDDYQDSHDVGIPHEDQLVDKIVHAAVRTVEISEIGPFLEELSKALVVFAIFLLLPHEFDGLLDGLIYGALIGLGFAMVENVTYLHRAQVSGVDEVVKNGAAVAAMAEAATDAFWGSVRTRIYFHGLTGHAMYTGLTGAGLGLARTARREWLRWSGPPAGFVLAVVAHMVWNSTKVQQWWRRWQLPSGADPRLLQNVLSNLTKFITVSLPFLILFLVVLVLSWRRERNALTNHLPAEGVTSYSTREIMLHRRRRRRALLYALRERGLRGWRAAARLQRTLIEWAFVRWHRAEEHLAEGVDADQIESQYQARAADLVQALGE